VSTTNGAKPKRKGRATRAERSAKAHKTLAKVATPNARGRKRTSKTLPRLTEEKVYLPPETWMPRFVERYRDTMNIRLSAQFACVDRSTVHRYLKEDEIFAAQVAEAREDALDSLEAAVLGRARDGVKEILPVYYKGKRVDKSEHVRKQFSDSLAIRYLEAYRGERFRPKQNFEVTGKEGGPIVFSIEDTLNKIYGRDTVDADDAPRINGEAGGSPS
jgi:hypothetical protein